MKKYLHFFFFLFLLVVVLMDYNFMYKKSYGKSFLPQNK